MVKIRMRVDVDEAGAGNAALGVDSATRFGCSKIADGHDATLLDGDVSAESRLAAAVEKLGVAD